LGFCGFLGFKRDFWSFGAGFYYEVIEEQEEKIGNGKRG